MDFKLENRGSYINVDVTGKLNKDRSLHLGQATKVALEVIKFADQTRIPKILCNAETLTGEIAMADRFSFGVFLAGKNLERLFHHKQVLKVAFLANPSLIDPGKIGATVARNRGLKVIVTSDKQEALKWLGVEEPAIEQGNAK